MVKGFKSLSPFSIVSCILSLYVATILSQDAVVEGWDVEDWDNKTTNQLIKSKQPKLEKVDIVTVSDDGTLKKWKPFLVNIFE